jgi:phosphatidylethanolamine-binding protein (PEBP) family uncharacterized protein
MRPLGRTHVPSQRSLPLRTYAASALTTALLALAGCGDSNKTTTTSASKPPITTTTGQPTTSSQPAPTTATTTTTPSQHVSEHTPVNEKVQLSSPVMQPEGEIPARYTCDGKDTPPPLRWETPPPGTTELMLDIIKITPVNNKLYFAWAITGIKPTTHQLNPPALPAGIITGTNSTGSTGYHLCPPNNTKENYVAVLFALTRHLPAKPGFNATQLRLQAENAAPYESLYIFHYTRK